jgi:hypothetical protein
MEVVASETLGDRNDLPAVNDLCGYCRPNLRNRRFMPPTIFQGERLLVAAAHPEAVSALSARTGRSAPKHVAEEPDYVARKRPLIRFAECLLDLA